jgi:NAD(P)-dependent dehydrogenase (short-subunit alcohol dehydrogenase family)
VSESRHVVLITGCSTGIGRVAAQTFLNDGWTVIATARRIEALSELGEAGCHIYALDVTDESSMSSTLDAVQTAFGSVDVLVNNAGYGAYGPVEQLSSQLIVRQFETNVFGLIRLSQHVLPMMRRQGYGRIINVSSIAGRLSLPMGGAYHASKHAVEAFSDALRYEIKPYGVAVSLVEPGPVKTSWATTAASSIVIHDETEDDPYAELKSSTTRALVGMTQGFNAHFSSTPQSIARVILRAANSSRPRSRYRVGLLTNVVLALRWLLPDRIFDLVISRTFASM